MPSAVTSPAVAEVLSRADDLQQETVRAYGLHEAQLAETLRRADAEIAELDRLEITTCLRRGELDMVTRFAAGDADVYRRLLDILTEHHGHRIFSTDGSTIDDQLIDVLDGRLIATAESCTGGLIAARLTARPGSSAYVTGGVVSYSNDAKSDLLDVPAEMITAHGAVSEQVAAAMAEGARRRLELTSRSPLPASPVPVVAPTPSRWAPSASASRSTDGRRTRSPAASPGTASRFEPSPPQPHCIWLSHNSNEVERALSAPRRRAVQAVCRPGFSAPMPEKPTE